MFSVGDYIIYGSNGVCKVENIGPLEATGEPKDRIYYVLSPVYINGGKVFTPVDNKKVFMRPVVSKEEAYRLISDIRDSKNDINIELLTVNNEKNRESIYKELIRTHDCRALIKIIITVSTRKKERNSEGKKMVIIDEKYLKLAQDFLFGELAIPLGIRKEEVEELIYVKDN